MASGIGRRWRQQDYYGDSDEVTLPSIVGRLSRLETTGFSYDELLHDFASRRRLGSLEECPATYVVDPAQETDEIVQAYLSLTSGGCPGSSAKWAFGRTARVPLALRKSAAIDADTGRRQVQAQRTQDSATLRTRHGPKKGSETPATEKTGSGVRETSLLSEFADAHAVPIAQGVEPLSTRCSSAREFSRRIRHDDGGGGPKQNVRQNLQIESYDSLEGHLMALEEAMTSSRHQRRRGSRSGSNLVSPVEPSRVQSTSHYYPSRTLSAEEAVSLISPRTSTKIRRLPPPGQIELETVEQIEHDARNFPAQTLELKRRGGLYSTLGRRGVGLIETDIDDLTATIARKTEPLAGAKRVAMVGSFVQHNGGVLASLLAAEVTSTLPTISPASFHDPLAPRPNMGDGVSRSSTPGSRSRPQFVAQHEGRRKKGGLERKTWSEAEIDKDLEASGRVMIFGVDEKRHQETLGNNLRRLRALLGESPQSEGGRPCSPSLFSVHELRMLATAQRRRPGSGGDPSGENEAHEVAMEREREGAHSRHTPGRAAAELSVGGNLMLRNLAIDLLSSVQGRLQKEFLLMGFRKWQAVLAQSTISKYFEAVLLIQSCLRRSLAIVEASERRRLRADQVRRQNEGFELIVRHRQRAALKLQRWIRGGKGRRRAAEMRYLRRAVCIVQRTVRARAARATARRRRKEELRCKEAAAAMQQREQEILEENRAVLARKVEKLAQRELLAQQRCHDFQQRFRREGAATRIQALWRGRVLRHNLSAYVRIGKRTRAIRIQRATRGFLARRELQRRRKAFQIRFESEIAAAIKIQSLARMGIAWNRVDEKRFQRNKEQLVSTMDAQRALRDRKWKVPMLKAIAAREGILKAEKRGEAYFIDTVALKVRVADTRRALNPWQESTDTKAATKIQALWRGYRQVVRVRRMKIRLRRERVESQVALKIKAAKNIQRVFRGRRARVIAKSRRYGLRAVRIQKVWRGFLGKRAAADRRQRIQAAILLQRRLRGAQARSLAARLRREAVTTSAPAITIQSAIRRHLAKRLRQRLVTERQIEWEWKTMAGEMARFCAERARLRVIVEGAAAATCRGDGVTQFIFRKLAVKRGGEEGSGSYRLEGRAFAKLFAGTPGLFNSLFHATDVDLIFVRVKDKEEKTITYAQFASALNVIAATLFPQTKRFREYRVFKGKAARLLELVEGKVLQAPNSTEYRQFCQTSGERYLRRSAGKIQAVVRGHLGRKRFKEKWAKRAGEERFKTETEGVITIQALARRYCARCRAIRLAQARISKFIDPTTLLPYWVHPGTGITSWSKPKVFGAEDVEHATVIATSRTEHLVKCSICDDRPVKRLCTSCRDSFCEKCFQALHGRGRRRHHVAPTVHMCCVCKYQHGSRLCETCTFKTSSTCAYCDVCFFARHPGLDPGVNGGAAKANTWTLTATQKQAGWNHRWTPLVVTCVECRRYAARWLCDDCEEVYCVACYTSVHRHGSKVNHGAEKLPYYPVDFHIEYAIACRKRSRTQRDEEAHANWLEQQEQARQRAATVIQAGWRGRAGRIDGRAHLKAGRGAQREAWRQRKRDDRKRKALWYSALDLAGLAPQLKSDRVDEQVLRKVPRLARTRPRKYIALNQEDDAWVAGKLDGRKGTVKRGFGVGKMEELKDQAKRGGVRLPGRHSVKTGHRCIYVDPLYDMQTFVKPRNVIRVEGEVFNVEAVLQDRLQVDRVWNRPDAEGVLLYKMVLNGREKLLLRTSKMFWSSQPVQYGIQVALVFEEGIINPCLRKAAMHYKKKRHKRLYGLAKSLLKKREDKIRSHKLMLNVAQFGLDGRPQVEKINKKEPVNIVGTTAPSSEADLAWSEIYDEETCRTLWKNSVTGEVCTSPPPGVKEKILLAQDLAEQREVLRARMVARKR